MSREQLILGGVLVLFILAGLPAFLLPGGSASSVSESASSSESVELGPPDPPETTLSLTKTTKAERKKIRYQRKVNINTADSATLSTIPNVGPNRAKAILKFRKDGGVFHNKKDLRKIEGFGKRRAQTLAKHVKYGKENYQKPTSSSGKIDINKANKTQLKKLSGVGSVTAQRIVEYREENGPFQTYSDLDEIPRIGPGTIDNFAEQISGVSGDLPESSSGSSGSVSGSININSAGQSELESLPGVGPVTAKSIIEYRESNGQFGSVDELDKVSGIGSATLEDIRPRATAQ